MLKGEGGTSTVRVQSANARQAAYEERMRADIERRERRRTEKAERSRKRRARQAAPEAIPPVYKSAAEEWHRMPWLQICEACREHPADEAHHVIKEQTLKKFAKSYGFDLQIARFDVRNRLWVCSGCHVPHTNASKRIHVSVLQPRHFEFADEHKLTWALEREYDQTPREEVA